MFYVFLRKEETKILFLARNILIRMHTHISFVFESVFASSTMKMCGALSEEDAVLDHALFGCPISLETLLVDCGVLPVIIWVHLHVARANVGLVTFTLYAVIMCLLSVVLTVAKLNRAVVRRCKSQKAIGKLVIFSFHSSMTLPMIQWLRSLFVPF